MVHDLRNHDSSNCIRLWWFRYRLIQFTQDHGWTLVCHTYEGMGRHSTWMFTCMPTFSIDLDFPSQMSHPATAGSRGSELSFICTKTREISDKAICIFRFIIDGIEKENVSSNPCDCRSLSHLEMFHYSKTEIINITWLRSKIVYGVSCCELKDKKSSTFATLFYWEHHLDCFNSIQGECWNRSGTRHPDETGE